MKISAPSRCAPLSQALSRSDGLRHPLLTTRAESLRLARTTSAYSPQQQARRHCITSSARRRASLTRASSLSRGRDDFQHSAHVSYLPVLARRLIVCAVAFDAGRLHDAHLSVADNAPPTQLGELMDRLPPLALAQTPQQLALEFIPRPAVGSPRERVVAVLTHLDACPPCQPRTCWPTSCRNVAGMLSGTVPGVGGTVLLTL